MSNTQDQSAHDLGGTPSSAGAAPGAAGSTGTTAGQAESARRYVPRQSSGYAETTARTEPSGWVLGFTMTAAVLMMLSGAAGFFEGLAAVINGRFYVVRPNYAFETSVTGWGWIHLIIGVALFLAGLALLADQTWARIVGVVVASFSALANFLFIPYYPLWSIVLIALDGFIIWALLSPRRESRW